MKTWEKLSLIIYVMYGNPLFQTYCREALWATRPQVTKVAMLGYNFVPSWDEVLRCNLHQSKA